MFSFIRRALADFRLIRAADLPHVELIIADPDTALRLGHPKIIANDLWPDALP